MEDFDNPIPEKGEDDQFPIGLKVLAIDADLVCLRYLVQLLLKCQYKVTATTEAAEAIRLVKDKKQTFDLVITNVARHDMDGFKILEIIGLGMDIPVVMVSANEELDMVKRAVMEGAEAYLLKPVRLQDLKNIWQHVLRRRSARKRLNPNVFPLEQAVLEDQKLISHETVTINKQDYESDQIIKLDDHHVASSSFSNKKYRLIWTEELHDKFITAYEQLGETERVPKKIWKLMKDPSVSRGNVASHLQKYRYMLRRKKGAGGAGKLVSQKNHHARDPYKASTVCNSMNQTDKLPTMTSPNLGPQLSISRQCQFPNPATSSMEELQGNENAQATWMAAGNYFPTPEFESLNFPPNIPISNPCESDPYLGGFRPNNTNSYCQQYPLESHCLNSSSQTFGNFPIPNFGAIPEEVAPLSWPFANNSTAAGQCSQMQLDTGDSHSSLSMDDELSKIFKRDSNP